MNNEELPDNIKDILSRYYDGLTSLDEERQLKKYLTDHQLTESLLADQAILCFPKPDKISLFPASEIWDRIKQDEIKQNKFKKIIRIASSAAASLVIVFSLGTWYYLSSEKQKTLVTDTYSSPEEAYKAVQKYLGFASSKLSYAYTELKPIEKLTIPSEAMQSFSGIDKNLQRLNQLNRINSSLKELEQFSIITDIMGVDKN